MGLVTATPKVRIGGGPVMGSSLGRPKYGRQIVRDHWFDEVAPVAENRAITGESVSYVDVLDERFERTTGSTFATDFRWGYTVPEGRTLTDAVVRSSSNEAVIAPDPLDASRWVYASSGTATLTQSNSDRTAQRVVTTSTSGPSYVDVLDSYVPGSLIRHIHDSVQALVSGKTAGDATQLVSAGGTWNPTLFTGALDLSSIMIPSSGWTSGALVSPIHVLVSAHISFPNGRTVVFRRADGSGIVSRTVEDSVVADGDIRVLQLNAPVTFASDGVNFAKVLPKSVTTKWKTYDSWRAQLPLLKAKHVGGQRLGLSMAGAVLGSVSAHRPDWMAPWYVDYVTGDSGSSVGTVVNGEYVFLGNAATGPGFGDDGAASILHSYDAVNAAMAALGGGSLTDVSLSAFTTY